VTFKLLSPRHGKRAESELVARAYKLASQRGLESPKVEVREAWDGEFCKFGVPARTVVEVRA